MDNLLTFDCDALQLVLLATTLLNLGSPTYINIGRAPNRLMHYPKEWHKAYLRTSGWLIKTMFAQPLGDHICFNCHRYRALRRLLLVHLLLQEGTPQPKEHLQVQLRRICHRLLGGKNHPSCGALQWPQYAEARLPGYLLAVVTVSLILLVAKVEGVS